MVKALSAHAFAEVIRALCAVFGAGGLGYAASCMRRTDGLSLAGAMMTSGALGCTVVVFAFLARPRLEHLLRSAGNQDLRALLAPAVTHAFIDSLRDALIE